MVGLIYSIVAVGYVLIYRAMKALNFAHPYIVLTAAYIVLQFYWITGSLPIALVTGTLVLMFLGFIIGITLMRRFIGESPIAVILVTLGVGHGALGLTEEIWGLAPQPFPLFTTDATLGLYGPISITYPQAFVVVFIILIGVGIILSIKKSRVGIRMRAASEDQQAALTLGIPLTKMFALAWLLTFFTAVMAAFAFSHFQVRVSEALIDVGWIAIAAALVGGLDSITGAFVGGIVIALSERLGTLLLDPILGGGFGRVFPFLVILFIIVFKPYGIFGTHRIERV